MRKIAIFVLIVGSLAAFAQKPEPSTSNSAIFGPGGQRGGGDAYSTGFESGEGFSAGFLGVQNSWSVFVVSSNQPVISTADAQSGSQSLEIALDNSIANGNLTGGFSPQISPSDPNAPSSCIIWVKITDSGGADYDVAPQAPSQGFLSARVNFRFTGPIRVLDGGNFVDTGATWTPNTWHKLRIDLDPNAPSIEYYLDDALIYQASALVGGTTIEQVVLISDNWQVTDSGFFDNLTFGKPCSIDSVTLSGTSGTIFGQCDAIDVYALSLDGVYTLLASGEPLSGSHNVNNIPSDSYLVAVAAGGDPAVDGVVSNLASVPTLQTWGMLMFLTLLVAGGIWFMRRQKQVA